MFVYGKGVVSDGNSWVRIAFSSDGSEEVFIYCWKCMLAVLIW